jgi:hypothetical protein
LAIRSWLVSIQTKSPVDRGFLGIKSVRIGPLENYLWRSGRLDD